MNFKVASVFLVSAIFPVFCIGSRCYFDNLAQVNKKLTVSTYPLLVKVSGDNNLVYSPFNLNMMLSFFYLGTNGTSRLQIANTGFIPKQLESFKLFISELQSKLQTKLININNKIFIREDIHLNKIFSKVAKQLFQTTAMTVYFRDKPEESVKAINKWVASQIEYIGTPDIVNPKNIHKSTNMIFVGTIFLNLTWEQQFQSKRDIFYKHPTQPIPIVMLQRTGFYGYYDNNRLRATFVEIPYVDVFYPAKRKRLSMVIVLPYELNGLRRLESNIEEVFKWQPFIDTYLNLSIPEFITDSVIDFKSILKILGVKNIFNQSTADFSNLAYNNYTRYFASRVVQKAYIGINERGTIATAVGNQEAPTRSNQLFAINFVANHPFIYYIQRDNVILFVGRILE